MKKEPGSGTSSAGDMDTVNDLKALGYSEYEARVYLALLARPEVTGYEASKYSGVPRSKVYEVLEGLVTKGAALAMELDDRRIFRPRPYQELVEMHRQSVSTTLERLESTLASYTKSSDQYDFFALSGLEALLARCRDTIDNGRRSVFISCWPEEHAALAEIIEMARQRGVQVAVLIYQNRDEGPGGVDDEMTFYHTVTPMQHEQLARLGRWLFVTADNIEVTLGQIRESDTVALCSRNEMLAFLISQTVAHDIAVMELARNVGADEFRKTFTDEEWERLQLVQMAAGSLTSGP